MPMQPNELYFRILFTISKHENGASTYRVFQDLHATGFRNKPRIMRFIKTLRKNKLTIEVKVSDKKTNQELTDAAKMLVETKAGIDSFFGQLDLFSKQVSEQFRSTNDNVLRTLGWTTRDIAAKHLYFLRITNLVLQAGIYFNNFLMIRYLAAIKSLQSNKFALTLLQELFIDSMNKFYEKQPLKTIQISASLLERNRTDRDVEFEENYVLSALIRSAHSDLIQIQPEKHCSVIREDLTRLKEYMHALIDSDMIQGPESGLRLMNKKLKEYSSK